MSNELFKETFSAYTQDEMYDFIMKSIKRLPEDIEDSLYESHERYQILIGITAGTVDDEKCKGDSSKYGHYIELTDTGSPTFSESNCATMMSDITGYPYSICYLYTGYSLMELINEGCIDDPGNEIKNGTILSVLTEIQTLEKEREVVMFMVEHKAINSIVLDLDI